MEKQFDVLVIGELNVDLILNQIEKFPEMGKEIIAERMTMTLGSSSAIFASNLSTLGSRVSFVGQLGQDSFGDHVITSLQSKGVNTEYVLRSSKQACHLLSPPVKSQTVFRSYRSWLPGEPFPYFRTTRACPEVSCEYIVK